MTALPIFLFSIRSGDGEKWLIKAIIRTALIFSALALARVDAAAVMLGAMMLCSAKFAAKLWSLDKHRQAAPAPAAQLTRKAAPAPIGADAAFLYAQSSVVRSFAERIRKHTLIGEHIGVSVLDIYVFQIIPLGREQLLGYVSLRRVSVGV